ncbi:MAG: AMP-binding protein, partial [bacterium]|nr:AMP-binding protein [bacterium]
REGIAGLRIINGYGPTEATVCSTLYNVRRRPEVERTTPIGRGLRNTSIHLLDRHLRPVPAGVGGELAIGGDGLARGYQHRPQLTAERFIPDPFSEQGGARLYRTGDLVRALPAGEMMFQGRIDHQVKVRGYRIELGEIEAVLSRHPAVRECAVLVREDRSGDRRLVAFCTAEGEPATAELRDFLQERLPEYMVPSVALVEVLPLTPAGKIDRAALSRQALPAPGAAGPAVAPRDTLELRLTRILEELLGVQPVGIRDDFFELGGHSLLAVRLMARIRHELGLDLPLTALFQGATVEQLAVLLRRQPGAMRREALVAIQPQGSRPPFFCVHPVGGHVLCYAALARQLGSDQPFYGLQVPDDEGALFLTEIREMAEHYVEAVREVQPEGPYRLGGWSMGGLVAFEMARQLVEQGREVERLVLIDSRAPAAAPGRIAEIDDVALALVFARDLGGISGESLPLSPA